MENVDCEIIKPRGVFAYNGEKYTLSPRDKSKNETRIAIVDPDKANHLSENFKDLLVPKALFKPPMRRLLRQLCPQNQNHKSDKVHEFVAANSIKNSMPATIEGEYHNDQREYPGLPNKIDGKMKARFDLALISELHEGGLEKMKNEYKFGIYQQ